MFQITNPRGRVYYLHQKNVVTGGQRGSGKMAERTEHYFAPLVEANPSDMPEGWGVGGFHRVTGKPFLAPEEGEGAGDDE